jgi:hypothetical protein
MPDDELEHPNTTIPSATTAPQPARKRFLMTNTTADQNSLASVHGASVHMALNV